MVRTLTRFYFQLEQRIAKLAHKTHKDRVSEFNAHLESLSEHHDIPKVGTGFARTASYTKLITVTIGWTWIIYASFNLDCRFIGFPVLSGYVFAFWLTKVCSMQ